MIKVLAIDPSIHNLGWCVMTEDKKHGCGLIRLSNAPKNWRKRIPVMVEEVMKIYRKVSPTNVVVEMPEHWSGQEGLAARESGSVMKLAIFVGWLCGVMDYQGKFSRLETVTPSQWKGQLPKKVIDKRLRRAYGDPKNWPTDHNIVDAIGIAYWFFEGEIT